MEIVSSELDEFRPAAADIRILDNSLISGAKLLQKLQPEAGLFTFIPVEGTLHVVFDASFCLESIALHFGVESRSITSKAGLAEEGSSR